MTDKKAKLKEVAPHIWSMYQHLTSVRSTLENRLNYFLAIDALLLIGFLQVFQLEVRAFAWGYIVPCILLVIPIVLLLSNFLAKQMRGAWMDFEHTPEPILQTIERDEFYERWIADMYSCAEGSWKYRKRIHRLLRVCVAFVVGALSWIFAALLWAAFCCSAHDISKAVLLSSISVIIGVLVYVIPERLKDFPYGDRKRDIRGKLNNWLNSNDVNPNDHR